MAIWVSRYSNKELQRTEKYYPVGISLGKPKFNLGYDLREQCYSLAPAGYMFNMQLEEFRPAYFEKLNKIGKDKIIDLVRNIESKAEKEGKDLVLLCYEDIRVPGEWCHRTVFADWWKEKTGETLKELHDPTKPKIKKNKKEEKKEESTHEEARQLSFFDLIGVGV